MRNLKAYDKDCFEIHTRALDRKQDRELKTRLRAINNEIKKRFDTYSILFNEKGLTEINESPELFKYKEQLISLYDYQSKTIRELRAHITSKQFKTITNTCQNCSINSINTLDHILPKATFPEFSVNPKNLFPCCSECNSYKQSSIEDDNKGRFLNLYIDKLPDKQYLYVDIKVNKNKELDFHYFLKNPKDQIPNDLFSNIEFHYEKLRLLHRFRLHSIEYISELDNKIYEFIKLLPLSSIISSLNDVNEKNKNAYGRNHWKYILESALLNNSNYMGKFK